MLRVQRHKTAIRRVEISRPIRLALEHQLLSDATTFFDYGCGHGDDITRLKQQGIDADGPRGSPKSGHTWSAQNRPMRSSRQGR